MKTAISHPISPAVKKKEKESTNSIFFELEIFDLNWSDSIQITSKQFRFSARTGSGLRSALLSPRGSRLLRNLTLTTAQILSRSVQSSKIGKISFYLNVHIWKFWFGEEVLSRVVPDTDFAGYTANNFAGYQISG